MGKGGHVMGGVTTPWGHHISSAPANRTPLVKVTTQWVGRGALNLASFQGLWQVWFPLLKHHPCNSKGKNAHTTALGGPGRGHFGPLLLGFKAEKALLLHGGGLWQHSHFPVSSCSSLCGGQAKHEAITQLTTQTIVCWHNHNQGAGGPLPPKR